MVPNRKSQFGAKIQVFWKVKLRRLVKISRHIEGSLCFHFQGQAAIFIYFLNFQQHLSKYLGCVTYREYVRTGAEGNIWTQEGQKVVGEWIGLCNEELHDM
jgi:hypothetical protein